MKSTEKNNPRLYFNLIFINVHKKKYVIWEWFVIKRQQNEKKPWKTRQNRNRESGQI